jgi:hypothetical protein
MSKLEYAVVIALTHVELVKKVNEKLREGWELYGSVAVFGFPIPKVDEVPLRSKNPKDPSTAVHFGMELYSEYVQPMIKRTS